MLQKSLQQAVAHKISDELNHSVDVTDFQPVMGGSINRTGKVSTTEGDFFIKWNAADQFPNMFEKEAKGLKLLGEPDVIYVPEVLGFDATEQDTFLIMEFIRGGRADDSFWKEFGRQLAQLHQVTNDYFGLDHHNYMGALEQYNDPHQNWIDFFVEQRLKPQVALARDNNEISKDNVKQFRKLYPKLESIFPEEPPALIHGDLYSGNFMITENNEPCLIDPAAYYGHREADLAMTRMFGRFEPVFYDAYQEVYPLEQGWWDRLEVYQLYPLMIHVNLFGAGGYLSQTESILKHYI